MTDRKFERLARLVSQQGVDFLSTQHVVVCGMGGVGSWACEAIVRSGVGRITLVDFDVVTATTLNRQMPGLETTINQFKVDVMAERLKQINSDVTIRVIKRQIQSRHLEELFEEIEKEQKVNYLVDAIDQLGHKCAMLAYCRQQNIPVVTSMGAGGRFDPTKIEVVELAKTKKDGLARWVRIYLRKKFGFPRYGKFGIWAVCSTEDREDPLQIANPPEVRDVGDEADFYLPLEPNKIIQGTACFVTSVYGMTCASVVVRELLKNSGIPGVRYESQMLS